MNIERGTFTPLVFSVSGVLGKNALCSINLWLKKKVKNLMKIITQLSMLLDVNDDL